eukprot:1549291-Pleurochrysis_carterae.AAC.2
MKRSVVGAVEETGKATSTSHFGRARSPDSSARWSRLVAEMHGARAAGESKPALAKQACPSGAATSTREAPRRRSKSISVSAVAVVAVAVPAVHLTRSNVRACLPPGVQEMALPTRRTRAHLSSRRS